MKRVAFIGSAGVPNRYGGFEAFLEACGPMFAQQAAVTITCDPSRYTDHVEHWCGVRRKFVCVPANGAWSIVHDVVAFMSVVRTSDYIVVLGVSAGIFFPLMRLVCQVMHKRLIVNVDGVEWRRAKFGRLKRIYLWGSDWLAQRFAHDVVVDNEALVPFLARGAKHKARVIAYPGDQVRGGTGPIVESQLLTICRIEPENNCHLLLETFRALGRCSYTFVGNWSGSPYGRELRAKYAGIPGLVMEDPIYDEEALHALRASCGVYLHGHSVGGTNPSLVEMLFYDCRIYAYDCAFNKETARDQACYFLNESALIALLRERPERSLHSAHDVRSRLTRDNIVRQYMALLRV